MITVLNFCLSGRLCDNCIKLLIKLRILRQLYIMVALVGYCSRTVLNCFFSMVLSDYCVKLLL